MRTQWYLLPLVAALAEYLGMLLLESCLDEDVS